MVYKICQIDRGKSNCPSSFGVSNQNNMQSNCLYWRKNIETNEKARRSSLVSSSFSSFKQQDGCYRNLTERHAINDYGLF